jgi:hypothetical protein
MMKGCPNDPTAGICHEADSRICHPTPGRAVRGEVNPHDRPLTREELLEEVRNRDAVLCMLPDKIDAEVLE